MVTYVLICCDRGETVIPQLTQNDHNPFAKWKVAETIPII
jgi:hypothetical protein